MGENVIGSIRLAEVPPGVKVMSLHTSRSMGCQMN